MKCKDIKKKLLQKIVVSYFQGKYQDSISAFKASSELFLAKKLSNNDIKNWEKLLSLFLLGRLVRLSSLNST